MELTERTASLLIEQDGAHLRAERFALVDARTGQRYACGAPPRTTLGKADRNDVVLPDQTVSRFHCELVVEAGGVRCRDLDSTNGTRVAGVRVTDAWLSHGDRLRLGDTELIFEVDEGTDRLRLSPEPRFGDMVGTSATMRLFFAQLGRAAASDASVLLQGETGTGKERAARGLHEASHRARQPFVVVDVAGLSGAMTESELFGYERGAFTGAERELPGAFERAHRGTIFLDQIGELPLGLQPKLLRVLETRSVRRMGAIHERALDFRLVASTRHDLRRAVNRGTFRADLFYRLAVLELEVPPLRDRPEDVPGLAVDLLDELGVDAVQRDRLLTPELLDRLTRLPWPGNVRQLRNRLERLLVLGAGAAPADPSALAPYDAARRDALEAFERAYVEQLLDAHQGNVTAAAKHAGMARGYLHRLIRRARREG